jgi:alpha-L-rhamnosidase
MRSNTIITGVALLLVVCRSAGTAETTTMTSEQQRADSTGQQQWVNASGAQWVWPASAGDRPNQYFQLIHDFTLTDDSPGPQLAISADSNYAAWLNGTFVDFGQWSDFPDDKTFDLLDLGSFAKAGSNRLAILAWYQGQSTSQYLKGPPGVMYAVRSGERVVAVSGPETRMRPAPDYVSGPVPRVSPQLSFTFQHDGGQDDGWLRGGYVPDASWIAPGSGDMKPLNSRPVRSRPIAKLTLGERLPMRVLSQGTFSRTTESTNPAIALQTDCLAFRAAQELFENPRASLPDSAGLRLRNATHAYIVLDAGREEAGVLELELDAPEGTVFDVGYGEHLEDLRVRAHIGGRNFAVRHVSGAGRHTFMHPFLRLAGRYLQVHITMPDGASAPVTIYYAGLRPTDYPVPQTGAFESPDSLHNRIWDVSARTLHLCMHEHYEDCPWREQALYAMDGRNQALAGYYCFGNYDFAAASLDLLAKGMNDDGWLELCAPASVPITIPSFSLAWILALDDYLLFSGDRTFVRDRLPVARRILETAARESTGPVIVTPRGPRMWNYYEWAPGMDGSDRRGTFGVLDAERFDAPLNLFYLLALDAAARMAHETGTADEFTTKARELRAAFTSTFWDSGERAVVTRAGAGQAPHFAELTQALAIIAGVVPEAELDQLRERLAGDGNGFVASTLSHMLYKFEALLTDRERFAPRVFELIKRDWGYMLAQGATSFWETIDGASAFGNAGSLCHGWSGIPAWFYGAYVLGVRPTTPGFAEYKFEPVRGVFDRAKGTVPTPGGPIDVEWRIEKGEVVPQVKRR